MSTQTSATPALPWVVTRPSAISGTCLIGEGATKQAAMAEAFGPKPWSSYAKGLVKRSDIYVVQSEDDLQSLRDHVHAN
jgi:hypothetical protein